MTLEFSEENEKKFDNFKDGIVKQQFLDDFAHVVRTPLTSIYGFAQYMQKAHLNPEELNEITQYIIAEAKYMKTIVDSLMELEEMRGCEIQKEKISIAHLFEDVYNQIARGKMNKVESKFVIRTNINSLEGEKSLLERLLLNLCFNSLNACTKGEGRIYLEAMEESGLIIISVTDNGCGMSKGHLERVFEPFYRVDQSKNREKGGLGLGLTFCKRIALLHNAEMIIESEEYIGTKVQIIFKNTQ